MDLVLAEILNTGFVGIDYLIHRGVFPLINGGFPVDEELRHIRGWGSPSIGALRHRVSFELWSRAWSPWSK